MPPDLAFSIASNVLQKLVSNMALEEISLAWGVKEDLQKLKETTSALKAVLHDAEKKQKQNEQLRILLNRLKDVFQDAQDVLDEFECEVLRSQVVKRYGNFDRKVRRFFSRSNSLVFRFSIAHKIKDTRKKLDDIAKEMSMFQFISIQLNEEQTHLMHGPREMTHSYVNASNVIGRDSDKLKIIDMLMHQDHNSDSNISVISIVGMGGLGKTTLAKIVYNDKTVVDKFDLRMWVCVSLDFNVTELVREILKSALKAANIKRDITNWAIDLLQISLRNILKDKTFFLVLDDVWNNDLSKWNELKDFLSVGAKGSKIVVTTRNTFVASIMSRTPPYQLKILSHDDSLSLFFKCAFGDEHFAKQNPKLKDIGKKIVKKCKGVPLALKTLGCLLYSKTEIEWNFIRDNEIWEIEPEHCHILPALQLSYNTMSPGLRQCFAYCSTFPEDSSIYSLDLIWIWTALGFLQSPNDKMELEDIGQLNFRELCSRSFFQCDGNDKNNYGLNYECRMHDLIHDLACSITQSECAMISSNNDKISEKIRHLRIFLDKNNSTNLLKLKKVRSVYIAGVEDHDKHTIDESFLSACISRFKYLRVFDLRKISFEVLPSSIGTLKHLRYLNLSENTKIKKIPNSICKLQSLQTLMLDGSWEIEELPRDIGNLVSLRTLFITTKQTYLQHNGLGRLKSLQFLGLGNCENLRSLPRDIRYCTNLRTLIIAYCEQLDLASEAINEDVQLSLQTMVIDTLPEMTTLPQWLQGAAKTLQNLHIEDCPKLITFPEWLPNLTSLEKLVIKDCPNLMSLPVGMQRLTSLTHLEIVRCCALKERCKCGVGEDWPKIAHVPNISISDDSYFEFSNLVRPNENPRQQMKVSISS